MTQSQKASAEAELDETRLFGNAGQRDRSKTRWRKRANSEMQNVAFQDEYIRLSLNTYVAEEESLSAPVK